MPEPDIHLAISRYASHPSPILHISDQLLNGVAPDDPLLNLNPDGVCTFLFNENTSTRDIAHFLCCAVNRRRYDWGGNFVFNPLDDEIRVYRYVMGTILEQGRPIQPGLTGIPIGVGLPDHHPLSATLCAHRRHAELLTFQQPLIVTTESWSINRFRRRRRLASLVGAVVNDRLPVLQRLPDTLVRRGILLRKRQLRPLAVTDEIGAAG